MFPSKIAKIIQEKSGLVSQNKNNQFTGAELKRHDDVRYLLINLYSLY